LFEELKQNVPSQANEEFEEKLKERQRIARIEANNRAALNWLAQYNSQQQQKQLAEQRKTRVSVAYRAQSSTERVLKLIEKQRIEANRITEREERLKKEETKSKSTSKHEQ